MRRPSIYTDRREPLDVKMTPMIDVVFLLLIFFVWTASFQIVEYVLPSSVSEMQGTDITDPSEPPPPEADFHQIVVRLLWVTEQPSWRVGDEAFADLAGVRDKLSRIFAANDEAPVIVDPDDDTPYAHVVDLYDMTRQIGFSKVELAASMDQ